MILLVAVSLAVIGGRGGVQRLRRRFEANLAELAWAGPGHGHPDVATAVRDTLGTDLTGALAAWRQWLTR